MAAYSEEDAALGQRDLRREVAFGVEAENDLASARAAVQARRIGLAAAMGLEALGDVALSEPSGGQGAAYMVAADPEEAWIARLENFPFLRALLPESEVILSKAAEAV